MSHLLSEIENLKFEHISINEGPVCAHHNEGDDIQYWNNPDRVKSDVVASDWCFGWEVTLDSKFIQVVTDCVLFESNENWYVEKKDVHHSVKDVVEIAAISFILSADPKVAEQYKYWDYFSEDNIRKIRLLKCW